MYLKPIVLCISSLFLSQRYIFLQKNKKSQRFCYAERSETSPAFVFCIYFLLPTTQPQQSEALYSMIKKSHFDKSY